MSQNLVGGQSLFRARSQLFPERNVLSTKEWVIVNFSFFLALRIKPDEILRKDRYEVEERWLELDAGVESDKQRHELVLDWYLEYF